MKKNNFKQLLAILLISVMVVGMYPPVNAVIPPETKEGAFFSFLYAHTIPDTHNLYSPWRTNYQKLCDDGPKLTAEYAAQHLNNMPEGKRCIDLTGISVGLSNDNENWLWWDNGADKLSVYMNDFYKALKEKGVKLDYVIDDLESGMSNWLFTEHPKRLEDVVNDPRYATEIRPMLVEAGFEFSKSGATELDYLDKFWLSDAFYIWNALMANRKSDYYKKAFSDPLHKYYPDAKDSNYGDMYTNGKDKIYSIAGHRNFRGGARYAAGTHSAPELYSMLGQIDQKSQTPEDYLYEIFPINGFNSIIHAMAIATVNVISTDKGNLMPWVGLKHWMDSKYSDTYCYDEFIFHLTMLNSDPFLMYNIGGNSENEDLQYFSKLLDEVNQLVGTGKRRTLVDKAVTFDQRYILSGLELEDKNLWRITPDLYTPGITTENFLSDKNNMIFQIGNQVVDFPEGSKILEIDSMSDGGYWVTSPKGTRPQEIRAEGIDIPAEQISDNNRQPLGYTVDKVYQKYVPGKTQQQPEVTTPPSEENKEETPTTKPVVDTSSVAGHWAARSLTKAVADGLIVGSDKGLEPDRNVTKAELITMILRAVEIENNQSAGPQWYSYAANKAVELGWTNYLGDIEYDINRASSAEIIANVLKLDKTVSDRTFTDDAQISSTGYLGAVKGCAALGIITGYPQRSIGNVPKRPDCSNALF